jgi:hypothetical protein
MATTEAIEAIKAAAEGHQPEPDVNGYIDCTCGWRHDTANGEYWEQQPWTDHLIEVIEAAEAA